jgi:hypothetical protein
MKSPDDSKIAPLLLDFSALSKSQQSEFLGCVNRFLFVSPSHRRRLVECWRKRVPATPADTTKSRGNTV